MLQELVERSRKRHALSHEAGRFGVAGWSMGGYGAVKFAETHPGGVSFAASILGLLDFPKPGDEALPVGIPAAFGVDRKSWEAASCMERPEALAGKAALIIAATEAWDYPMSARFHSRLLEAGVRHDYLELPGGHEWGVVAKAIPILFDFVERHFRTRMP